jgi:hypothetical protein
MKFTLEKIKSLSSSEYMSHRKEIRKFLNKLSNKDEANTKKSFFEYNPLGKECCQCLDFKSWDEFCYDQNTKDNKSLYCKECRNQNMKLKRLTNINLRLSMSIRNRINTVLKKNIKSDSTFILIGCSIDELKVHIERQFKPGMSWNNYGRGWNKKGMQEWHIDHIIPCSKFDLTNEIEQRKCFHFTNLQPLWASENLNKSKN